MSENTNLENIINKVVTVVRTEVGLKDYEAADLAQTLAQPHFNEFWFPGNTHGSFKLFLNARGIPFVYDQNNGKLNKVIVKNVNEKLQAIFA